MKKLLFAFLIVSVFILTGCGQEVKMIRMTREQLAEREIDQDRVVKRVGDDYLIKEER